MPLSLIVLYLYGLQDRIASTDPPIVASGMFLISLRPTRRHEETHPQQ